MVTQTHVPIVRPINKWAHEYSPINRNQAGVRKKKDYQNQVGPEFYTQRGLIMSYILRMLDQMLFVCIDNLIYARTHLGPLWPLLLLQY